ncbi:MAG: LysM domain-containing protein [Nitrosomonas sp.]|nr:LysM domain-containing protein [Nitrosomonas sp.]MCG7756169.1 LysM domain-containing protein [Nitrosomonas sp.]UJP00571.1 MAG: LysM domain-containing protein [Nitrosomonas sp.]
MIDPNEALQRMLQSPGLSLTVFPPTSRYYGIETAVLETADGEKIIYLKRRFVPLPERFELLQEHVVTQGQRLDNITVQYLGDPEQFWRICDANRAMRPEELEEFGRRLRITLPEGIPGIPDA